MVTRRLIPSVSMVPTGTPTTDTGKPQLAQYAASYGSSLNVTQGVGHTQVFQDPDPIWNGTIWTQPPPSAPAGSTFLRWSARSLADPTKFPNNEYYLGTPCSAGNNVDGSAGYSGIASPGGSYTQWNSEGSTTYSIPWKSDYPFKPRVASYTHHGKDGTKVITPRALHFTPHHVNHMWADFGLLMNFPFTIMICCVFTHFSRPTQIQYVLDAGRDPTTGTGALSAATRAQWFRHGVPARTVLTNNEKASVLGYRTGLQVHPKRVIGFNDPNPTTKIARVPFAHSLRPKVLYGVYNGNSSFFGVFGNSLKYPYTHVQRSVKLASHGNQEFMVLGRGNNVIDNARTTAMVVFEMRLWTGPLTKTDLENHHNQLASTWRFVEHT